ncbi:hypothetical protein ETJ91_22585 [Bacillus albus]|uniref:hypothetical protein n=1 Tax=Bacillus albus TaxID=2026189 RepID=UPI0010099D3A|nr:hypothetical protein [Bacillus albus]RXJ14965.1 hypothetical protein ETJ91_22585 [Bacillus albus]RXJ23825.1 hypothetical protein ETJ76_28490 [Bacillus albus]RXJ23984.1 hypothetical protein ETJ90_22335 [Bacillus albus]RXJ37310.1 hypothetical protein ETJ89_21475 [Bacillus albus]RXJ53447.1 hypothetical protein ETJ66_22885 [Bacillus albus]
MEVIDTIKKIIMICLLAIKNYLSVSKQRFRNSLVKLMNSTIYSAFFITMLYGFFAFFNIENVYLFDKLIDLGQSITDLLKYLLPITVTIYTFSYRERKQIASSSISDVIERIRLNFFVIFSLFSYLSGLLFYTLIDEKDTKIQMIYTLFDKEGITNYMNIVCVWYSLVILSIWLLFLIVRKAIKNINVTGLLPVTIELANKEIKVFKDMMNIWDGKKGTQVHKVLKVQKERVHAHIESTYQMLKYMSERNMNLTFEDNLKNIQDPLKAFNNKDFFHFEEGESTYIAGDKLRVYREVYHTILNNHVKLIISLFNEKKIIRGQKALKMLVIHLKPQLNNNALYQCYNKELFDLTSNFALDDVQNFNLLLEALNKVEKERVDKIYQNLILRAVESEDVKFLCNIVYPATRMESQYKYDGDDVVLQRIYKVLKSKVAQKIAQKDIHVILRAILKSIELGHYSCSGFLIKFLITKFHKKDIKVTLINFSEANANVALDFSENEQETSDETDDEKIYFNFNPHTFDYCYYKMVILIYGQQKFSNENRLLLKTENEEDINIKEILGECEYQDYLFEKIAKVGSDYGLLFVTDDDFMKSLKEIIKSQEVVNA